MEIYQRNDQLLITCSLKNSKWVIIVVQRTFQIHNFVTCHEICRLQNSGSYGVSSTLKTTINNYTTETCNRAQDSGLTLLRGPVRAEIVPWGGLKMADHLPTHSIWQSLGDPQGRKAENSKLQACKACWVKPKKTRGCNYCQRCFFKGHYSVKIMTVGCR